MIFEIPGYKTLTLEHIVLDFNGTIAVDGIIRSSVRDLIQTLSQSYAIHILTSDTQGTAAREVTGLPVRLEIISGDRASEAKQAFVEGLGNHRCVCIGNGRNDRLMFQSCALSVAVLEEEGLYAGILINADLLVRSTEDALKLLMDPKRLIADLRG